MCAVSNPFNPSTTIACEVPEQTHNRLYRDEENGPAEVADRDWCNDATCSSLPLDMSIRRNKHGSDTA